MGLNMEAFLPVISWGDVFKDFMSYCISIHIYCCRLKETLCPKNLGGGGGGAPHITQLTS